MIDPAQHLSRNFIDVTVLHEMVHLAGLRTRGHGLGFWREVDRLLSLGAPLDLPERHEDEIRPILNRRRAELFYVRAVFEKVDRRSRSRRIG